MKDLGLYVFNYLKERIIMQTDYFEVYVVENDKQIELIIKDTGKMSQPDGLKSKSQLKAIHKLENIAKLYNGDFKIVSYKPSGNLLQCFFPKSDMVQQFIFVGSKFLISILTEYPKVQIIYSQLSKKGEFLFDSKTFKAQFSEEEKASPAFLKNLKKLIDQETAAIRRFT